MSATQNFLRDRAENCIFFLSDIKLALHFSELRIGLMCRPNAPDQSLPLAAIYRLITAYLVSAEQTCFVPNRGYV